MFYEIKDTPTKDYPQDWQALSRQLDSDYRFNRVYSDAAEAWQAHRHVHPFWASFWAAYGQRRLGAAWEDAPEPAAPTEPLELIEDELAAAYEVLEDLEQEQSDLEQHRRWVKDDEAIGAGFYSYAGAYAEIDEALWSLQDDLKAAKEAVTRLEQKLARTY